MRLLQGSWSEILTLTLVFRSLPRNGKLQFASDFSVSESQANSVGLKDFYGHVSKRKKERKSHFRLLPARRRKNFSSLIRTNTLLDGERVGKKHDSIFHSAKNFFLPSEVAEKIIFFSLFRGFKITFFSFVCFSASARRNAWNALAFARRNTSCSRQSSSRTVTCASRNRRRSGDFATASSRLCTTPSL